MAKRKSKDLHRDMYERISFEHPRVDVKAVEIVNEAIIDMEQLKLDVTLVNIEIRTKVGKNKIRTALKWLIKYNLIKKKGSGRIIRYLVKIDRYNKIEKFLYDRTSIDAEIEKGLILIKPISKELYDKLIHLRKSRDKHFIDRFNEVVEFILSESKVDIELFKLDFRTKANRYVTV